MSFLDLFSFSKEIPFSFKIEHKFHGAKLTGFRMASNMPGVLLCLGGLKDLSFLIDFYRADGLSLLTFTF